MEKYDYLSAVKDDVRDYIEENELKVTEENRDEVWEQLADELFVSDRVTGNASGSYTFNSWVAEENLCHNMGLLVDALREFGYESDDLVKFLESAESCDVTIRCYLLSQAIAEVLDEILEETEV